MGELVLGIAAPSGASTLYSLGIALQAMDAKRGTRRSTHLRLALARRLVREAAGCSAPGSSILGFPLQVVALMLAPLVVVQPALAAGLLVLMFVGERMLGEQPGRYEYMCVCAIVLGVIGAALVRAAAQHDRQRGRRARSRSCSSALGVVEPRCPTSCARSAAPSPGVDDGLRRRRVRLERGRDEARLR